MDGFDRADSDLFLGLTYNMVNPALHLYAYHFTRASDRDSE
jgi:hypothetical protein